MMVNVPFTIKMKKKKLHGIFSLESLIFIYSTFTGSYIIG